MTVQEYMKLPYNYNIKPIEDESGFYYYATVLEFDGCQSHGSTYEEAFANIQEAMEGWIETKLEAGSPIPEPLSTDKV